MYSIRRNPLIVISCLLRRCLNYKNETFLVAVLRRRNEAAKHVENKTKQKNRKQPLEGKQIQAFQKRNRILSHRKLKGRTFRDDVSMSQYSSCIRTPLTLILLALYRSTTGRSQNLYRFYARYQGSIYARCRSIQVSSTVLDSFGIKSMR